MRIRYWSSGLCSSDLEVRLRGTAAGVELGALAGILQSLFELLLLAQHHAEVDVGLREVRIALDGLEAGALTEFVFAAVDGDLAEVDIGLRIVWLQRRGHAVGIDGFAGLALGFLHPAAVVEGERAGRSVEWGTRGAGGGAWGGKRSI